MEMHVGEAKGKDIILFSSPSFPPMEAKLADPQIFCCIGGLESYFETSIRTDESRFIKSKTQLVRIFDK